MGVELKLIIITFLPLLAAVIVGLLGHSIGRAGAHRLTIFGVGVSCFFSLQLFWGFIEGTLTSQNIVLYQWGALGDLSLEIGFLIDSLSAVMISIVTFVSLMVHIYTIGYMKDDPGYQRFFCYLSLFTFAMLMLVLSNNFLQLFFGWEAVGLVSYLLIGFWFKKDSAVFANLKAFLINRVGDLGFLIGIAAVLYVFGTLDYHTVFTEAKMIHDGGGIISIGLGEWSVITFICICLFIGAMGKSAQIPLHVWLPDSMEGPTPISALIHAATMVTAGIFMVARMSPLFELSTTALSFVLIIGALTAFLMGLMGIIQNDIKRVIAYSTLSQLGYMVAALGASAYAASIFHLVTHAFFKALLFLAAGSVIIGMHHIQDIQKMGNLKRYMPITHIVFLIGTLALIGMPFFSGFYSKDMIIESVHASSITGSSFAFYCLLFGVFFTALYSMRLYFLVFHTKERMNEHTRSHLQESPRVVIIPLMILAIPSICLSWWGVDLFLFKDFFDNVILVKPSHDSLATVAPHFSDVWSFGLNAFLHLPFWFMVLGIATAYVLYMAKPQLKTQLSKYFAPITKLLENKYYFDAFNQGFLVKYGLKLGHGLWKWSDQRLIDGLIINGSAKTIHIFSNIIRQLQTGYLYHYALVMLLGLLSIFIWLYIRTH